MTEIRYHGTILVDAKIENLGDLWNAERGELNASQIRSVTISEAQWAADPFGFGLPSNLIESLGLLKFPTSSTESQAGSRRVDFYYPARLTILGRSCTANVIELPSGTPARIGDICLGNLDLVFDPHARTLIGNPAHNGVETYDLY